METLTGVAIAVGACGAVLAIVIGIVYVEHRRRQRTRLEYLTLLKQGRSNATRGQFAAWFVERGLRESAAVTVYDYLQQRCAVPDFPFGPNDPIERVCEIVVHEEIDDILREMGYRALTDSEWDTLDWDALDLPPPSDPDAPIASLVYLIDALHERQHSARESSAEGAP